MRKFLHSQMNWKVKEMKILMIYNNEKKKKKKKKKKKRSIWPIYCELSQFGVWIFLEKKMVNLMLREVWILNQKTKQLCLD